MDSSFRSLSCLPVSHSFHLEFKAYDEATVTVRSLSLSLALWAVPPSFLLPFRMECILVIDFVAGGHFTWEIDFSEPGT